FWNASTLVLFLYFTMLGGSFPGSFPDLKPNDFESPDSIDLSYDIFYLGCVGDSAGANVQVNITGNHAPFTTDWSDWNTEAIWTFENSMNDTSGNAHNPTGFFGNKMYANSSPQGNYSFAFDGNTTIQYNAPGGFMETDYGTRTISGWIRPAALSGYQTIFEEDGNGSGLAIRLNNNILEVGLMGTIGLSSSSNTYSAPYPNDGAWHHIALTYDAGSIFLYLDGVQQFSILTPYVFMFTYNGAGGIGGTLGNDAFLNANPNFYTGLIDHFTYHNLALDSIQVVNLMLNNGYRDSLAVGSYTITVWDTLGCKDQLLVEVAEPDTLKIDFINDFMANTCPGGAVGSATATAVGGTAPYSFLWTSGTTTATGENLGEGWNYVTVTDAIGCTAYDSVMVLLDSMSYNIIPESCPGAGDGAILATAQQGFVSGYTLLWSTGESTNLVDDLSLGSYYLTIFDNRGCSYIDTIFVDQTKTNISFIGDVTDVTTFGGSNGAIDLTILTGTPSYSYSWSNGATSEDISGIPAGDYFVTVTGANGCSKIDSFTVIELIASGNLRKSVDKDSVLTGETFTYFLQYACAGTTTGCDSVILIDTLPAEVDFVSLFENPAHSTNSYYDAGANRVVFEINKENGTVLNQLTTGTVSVTVRFPNGTTPNGTLANNQAWLTAKNLAPGPSEIINTKALAGEKWTIDKTLGTVVAYTDRTYTYQIDFQDTASSLFGFENVYSIQVIDTLPAGVTFLSANLGGTYDGITNTVTWNLGDRLASDMGLVTSLTVDIQFPSTTFSTGDSLMNSVVAIGAPVGQGQQEIAADTTLNFIDDPSISGLTDKWTSSSRHRLGSQINWDIEVQNTSDVPVDSFVLTDSIPTQVGLTGFESGGYVGDGSISLTIRYQTNLSSTWQVVPGSPFDENNQFIDVSTLGLGAGEFISVLEWDYGTV
ncbi:MAG: hypothetical protein HKN16_03410, partial [Saprospiraceae bacterium]|nr:hypothetical protein [Saprospiraceae bacterium]